MDKIDLHQQIAEELETTGLADGQPHRICVQRLPYTSQVFYTVDGHVVFHPRRMNLYAVLLTKARADGQTYANKHGGFCMTLTGRYDGPDDLAALARPDVS